MSAISEPEVLDLLTRLVEKSLVVYEEDEQGNGRYRLLETVRQYGRETLADAGEREGVTEGHLSFYRGLLSEEAFAAAWAEGRALSWEQAIACALGADRVESANPAVGGLP